RVVSSLSVLLLVPVVSRVTRSLHALAFPTLLFSLITRAPPRSTLFPYTTLFRSQRQSDLSTGYGWRSASPVRIALDAVPERRDRSEEHTSELQSHLNLVCRLLLEKKKIESKTQRRRSNTEQPTTTNTDINADSIE